MEKETVTATARCARCGGEVDTAGKCPRWECGQPAPKGEWGGSVVIAEPEVARLTRERDEWRAAFIAAAPLCHHCLGSALATHLGVSASPPDAAVFACDKHLHLIVGFPLPWAAAARRAEEGKG